jgi:glycosyltransferase involved in cell wall biosynthesis
MLEIKKNKKTITPQTRIAVVHDWIFERRGGEKVLERILHLFPQADLFYLFGNPEKVLKINHKINYYPSFLNQIPFISKIYKLLLPLLPIAIESFNLNQYDLIISTSSCVAKGIIAPPDSKHISYIHSPMRYAWDQEHAYFTNSPSIFRPLELFRRFLLNRLRIWDVTSAVRIDKIIANSYFVARRCELYYGKKCDVIYPPVDTHLFEKNALQKLKKEETLNTTKKVLLFGAWVPYKKMLAALQILIENGIEVIAAGHGEEIHTAYRLYQGKAEFYIAPSDSEIQSIFAKAHVLLFPAIEDFGIVPLEATASGLWVVAPNKGGTAETVIHNVTGFTFSAHDSKQMIECVQHALQNEIKDENINDMLSHVAQFSTKTFDINMLSYISSCFISDD